VTQVTQVTHPPTPPPATRPPRKRPANKGNTHNAAGGPTRVSKRGRKRENGRD